MKKILCVIARSLRRSNLPSGKGAVSIILLSCVLSISHAQFGILDSIDIGKAVQGGTKMAKGASGIGIKEEMAIGGAVAVEIASHYNGLWKDPVAMKRINLIGKTLGGYSDRPELNYRFAILESPEINAFSAPGGYIFITHGAYDMAENDHQLAAILAHEITHVARRHALRMIARNEFISGLADVASGASSDFAAFDLGVDKIANTLFKSGYDSDSEFEADKVGRSTAKTAGYDAKGLLTFLKKLEARKGAKKGTFSTHPDLEDRIERLADKDNGE